MLADQVRWSFLWGVALLLVVLFVGLIDVQIISPILPLLASDFATSIAVMGMTVTVYSISAAVWALIIGPLSDRHGRMIYLRTAVLTLALAAVITFVSQQFSLFLVSRLLAGLAGGAISACLIAQLADIFPFAERGRVMGWVGAVYSISAVVGVPMGAYIADRFGWRSIYLLLAATALGVFLLLRSRQPVGADNSPRENHNDARPRSPVSIFQAVEQQIADYRRFWSQPATRRGLLLAVAVSATATSLMTYLGAWLMQAFALSVGAVAGVFLATGVATVFGSLFGGWLSDRFGKQRLVAMSSFLLAIILLLVYFVSSKTTILVFCVAAGLTIAMREGPYQALITELVPGYERGAYIAMRSTTAKLAIAVAAAVGGVLFESVGFTAVATFGGACSVCAALLARYGLVTEVSSPQPSTISSIE